VTTEPAQQILERTQQAEHPLCLVCGRANGRGLGLRFSLRDDSGVEACFECEAHFQGYDGLLHGGVTSTLMDGAMTNCLFAHGIVAVTAEITVRFRHPIALHTGLVVRAHIVRSQAPLHIVEAQIIQNGQVKAKASGKFMERPLVRPRDGAIDLAKGRLTSVLAGENVPEDGKIIGDQSSIE
jgi:acyl-coenzyme A thioesterase PaaI-like protein